ncbi:beta-galactosidase-like isoform X2 [Mytilus edulis]|uniref:beta-galactosidase-like isoform X2 n=1 Tax=Mytilus edulis TaxID=6550 RepID=UPI0039EF2624
MATYMFRPTFTFVFLFMIIHALKANRTFTIDYDNDMFRMDGKPFRYISGSIHYSRIPSYYWKDRLQKMKAAGLNAVQVYVPWNFHEMEENELNFEGDKDLVGFIKQAQEVDLFVVLRAGPYICGEWDFGGFPPYILAKNPNTIFRTMDSTYIKYVDKWLDVLYPMLKPLLYINGGPVLMVQIENEYGSYFACDYDYLRYLREKALAYLGQEVILITTDGSGDGYLKCGNLEGVYATVDFGVTMDPKKAFQPQRDWEPKGPLVNSEFYTGWLDHWGFKHSTTGLDIVAKSLDVLLAYGANINMYMFEGGTNFGYWNGANYPAFLPVPTSYDYDGPLTEAGDVTDKYLALRQVISKYVKTPPIPIPANTPKMAYGKIEMKFAGTVQDLLDKLRKPNQKPVTATYPVYMQAFGQYQGYALYRHIFKQDYPTAQNLSVVGIRDRGYVMIDQVPVGLVIRERIHNLSLSITAKKGQTLDILVENQGHINFGSGINNNTKGIIQNVTIGTTILTDWEMYPVSPELFEPSTDTFKSTGTPYYSKDGRFMSPSIYVGQMPTLTDPQDTYVDPTTWSKGQTIIRSNIAYNIGRYWPIAGPQIRLFVPKPYLAPNTVNNVIMFELEMAPCKTQTGCTVEFKDKPLINATAHGPYHKYMSQEIGYKYNWHSFH